MVSLMYRAKCINPTLKNSLVAPFCTFRVHIRVFAFVYVHVRHLGTSFRTSLYPVLSKNIALHKVY